MLCTEVKPLSIYSKGDLYKSFEFELIKKCPAKIFSNLFLTQEYLTVYTFQLY